MHRRILFLILLSYFVLGVLFAVYTPAWQAPDEPAHYNYVRYVAQKGALPILHFGDYPHGYLEQIKQARFPPEMSVEPIRYESHQPPLYYVLLAPVYTLTGGDLTALRLISVLLGAGIVTLAYGIGRGVFPARPEAALAAAAFVAFLPQHLATISQVGNDVLAELLYAAVLYLLVEWVLQAPHRSARRTRWWIGFLLGLIAITKTTAYLAVFLVAGVQIWRWVRDRASFRSIAMDSLALIAPAALLALPWLARNAAVYGWPDIFGLMRHGQIVTGQPRTPEFIAANGLEFYARRAVEFTFKSFWGMFGWLSVTMDTRVYFVLALFSGISLAGALSPLKVLSQPCARRLAALLGASLGLALLSYIYYNVTFVQHQGRYLFTALIPIGLAMAKGWAAAIAPRQARVFGAVMVVLMFALAAYDLVALRGLSKWPLALMGASAGGLVIISAARPAWRKVAYAAPFALLPLLSAYALFGVIAQQLAR